MAMPSCLRLLTHWARRAASRAAWTAGRSRAINTAMIANTTSSSISVKPRRGRVMGGLLHLEMRADLTGQGADPADTMDSRVGTRSGGIAGGRSAHRARAPRMRNDRGGGGVDRVRVAARAGAGHFVFRSNGKVLSPPSLTSAVRVVLALYRAGIGSRERLG